MAELKRKVALLSNVTADLVAGKLRKQYAFQIPEGFDTWIQAVVDPSSVLYRERPDAVILLLDGTIARSWKNEAEGTEQIRSWKQAATALAARITDIPIFITTVDFRENRIRAFSERMYRLEWANDWYQFLQGLAETKDNVFVIDLADTIAEMGRRAYYSNKMWYMSSMPYSRDGLAAVCTEIDRALRSAFSPRRKLIALDLDNTLWGGVIGEDGVEGIELADHKEGQRYFDFQRQLLEMKNRGIVLAVNSKNNPEDAEAAIREHPSMLLRDEDFVARKINWENKAANLKSMARELNLTEGGFIFIDDNPLERETVKGACPEVLVPDFPEDSTELIGFAETVWADELRPLRVLEEDRTKTQMYQKEAQRKQDMAESMDLDEYIARLEIEADIHRMRPSERERVAQLCGKTNQFNLTTRRYTLADIEQFASGENSAVYVACSRDKYGDNGLICVLILRTEGEDVWIDTFLMSCRVMGRMLENVIINELASRYSGKGRLIGEFIPTAKNVPVRDLYDRLGFALLSEENGHKFYALDLSDYEKQRFGTYKQICFQDE